LRNVDKSKEQLIREMGELRRQLAQLTASPGKPTLLPSSPDLTVLDGISKAFSSPHDSNLTLRLVVEELQRLLDVSACSVWLIVPESGELVRQYSTVSEGEPQAGWRRALGDGISGWVAQSGESLMVSDALSGPESTDVLSEGSVPAPQSTLTVPLRIKDRVIGVLEFVDETPDRFDAAFLDRVHPLAALGAMAVESAHLYDQNRRLSRFLNSVIHSPNIGIVVVDVDGKVMMWNLFAEALTGYSRGEVVGHDDVWERLLPDEGHRRQLNEKVRGVCEKREPVQDEEISIRTKGGDAKTISWNCVPLINEEMTLAGVVLLGRDVTEQVWDARAARRSSERLKVMREIDVAIIEAHSSEEVARAAVDRMRKLIPCRWANVILIDLQTDEALELARDAVGEGEAIAVADIAPWDASILERLQRGEPVDVSDLAEMDLPADVRGAFQSEGVYSLAMLPLIAQGELFGSLNLGMEHSSILSDDHWKTARAVADLLSTALWRAQIFDRMSDDRERLQQLSRRLLDRHEEERRRVARELHDEVGQTLAGLKMGWEAAARGPADEAQARLSDMQKMANELLTRVRDLSFDLRPTMLDDLGLVPALLWLFERYTEQTEIAVAFTHAGVDRRFESTVETAFYRIAQEAVANVAQHAEVGEVVVHLWTDEDALYIRVSDRGIGFDPEVSMGSRFAGGLAAIAERATLLGGYFTVESEPGAGTTVTVKSPIAVMRDES